MIYRIEKDVRSSLYTDIVPRRDASALLRYIPVVTTYLTSDLVRRGAEGGNLTLESFRFNDHETGDATPFIARVLNVKYFRSP